MNRPALMLSIAMAAGPFISFDATAADAASGTAPAVVPGSMDVIWNPGAADCERDPQPPLQLHRYEPQTLILRQNPCAHFEANFLYLLIGSSGALLVDTGAVAEAAEMPLAATVMDLLPRTDEGTLPLVVAHTHRHRDHRAGDVQFESLPGVTLVPFALEGVQAYFGLDNWPEDVARIDLGDRVVWGVPTPGHEATHMVFHDERTGVVLTGDFLLPGRLLVDDLEAYRASAARLIAFLEDRPTTHFLGGHIELDNAGQLFARQASHRPDERRLELEKDDLLRMSDALASFNGFYATHENFVVINPIRILLAIVAAVLAVLAIAGWAVWRRLRRRRRWRMPHA